jgi:HAD superfamily hydrolase (TIGR01458 family)
MKGIPYQAVLLDLEGTLYNGDRAIPGAVEAVARTREAGMLVRYVTNTTRLSRAALLDKLCRMGLEVREEELFTAVTAAAAWCRREGVSSILPLLADDSLRDLAGMRLFSIEEADDLAGAAVAAPHSGRSADFGEQILAHGESALDHSERPSRSGGLQAVLVGDLGDQWSYEKLNVALRFLHAGATLVACQKNRVWNTGGQLSLDAGPFVAALEYAAATEAVLVGKPSPLFFRSVLEDLQLTPRDAVMVGDDAEIDAGGAIAEGLAGWLVKTGKYRPGDESRTAPWPECVLDSIAELPAALGL